MKEIIRQLTETFGPSGHEERVRETVRTLIADHVDEIRTDAMGNLIALRRGDGDEQTKRRIMLSAHMDEIGIIVSHVDKKGFLRFQPIGGLRLHVLLGSRVIFADGHIGVIGSEKIEPADRDKVIPIDKLFIDIGATDRETCPVRVGDVAAFDRPFVDLGDRLIAKAFDDRIGCAILVETLRTLTTSPHDIYAVFSVQEEVGLRGAVTSAFGVAPEIGLAIDVTLTGDTPEAPTMAVSLGKGPAIKVKDARMLAHPGVKDWMVRTAEEHHIPYQLEVLAGGTTDAAAIQVSREGVAAGCLSIPCRYVHTPSEMVDYNDVTHSVELLRAMLRAPVTL